MPDPPRRRIAVTTRSGRFFSLLQVVCCLVAFLLLLPSGPPALGVSGNRLADDLVLVSVSAQGVKGNDHSRSVRLTSDGATVVFHSFASNLHPVDADSIGDIYRKRLDTGEVALASTADDGTKGNGTSLDPTVSSDGKHGGLLDARHQPGPR
jgi:hypothetical protein